MARFRRHGVKREHSILHEYTHLLERIAALPAVEAVIPGRIASGTRARPGVSLTVDTTSGVKLLVKSAHTVQEVFVVAPDPRAARAAIEELLGGSRRGPGRIAAAPPRPGRAAAGGRGDPGA